MALVEVERSNKVALTLKKKSVNHTQKLYYSYSYENWVSTDTLTEHVQFIKSSYNIVH